MSSFIPENAPFNKEQRAWLNGFFSGLIGIGERSGSASETLASAGLSVGTLPLPDQANDTAEEEEDFPWHDSALPIVDRMELADGKPVKRRLMAAMAQLDCGSCGYVCKTYAEAIASGDESNLTLCSPGGKETAKMIKKVIKEGGDAPSAAQTPASNGTVNGTAGYTRQNPFHAKLVECRPLNGDGSAKDTRHVVIDLSGSGIDYSVGDALGIYPTNCPDLTEQVVSTLAVDGTVGVASPQGSPKTLSQTLMQDCCLKDPSDELIELLISRVIDSDILQQLHQYLEDGVPDSMDVLDLLQLCQGVTISATEFVGTLGPLNPRLYSIASSPKLYPDQVHLTVGRVAFEAQGRQRKGVASTMLSDRLNCGDEIRVFKQSNHGGFTVPSDPNAPMIMIGPGTGIAPFIAFLQERQAMGAQGKNWLFFGDQHEAFDFLYRDQMMSMLNSGFLTRLHTAFSRDGDTKTYVQHRMQENAADLWDWLQRGAYVFVCGDASRMAADVDQTLCKIVSEEGGMSIEEAKQFVADLAKQKRYVRDVY